MEDKQKINKKIYETIDRIIFIDKDIKTLENDFKITQNGFMKNRESHVNNLTNLRKKLKELEEKEVSN